MALFFNKNNRFKGLFSAIEEVEAESKTGNYDIHFKEADLNPEEEGAIHKLSSALGNYKKSMEYDLMKYRLTSDSLGIALWDMTIENGDPFNPASKITWSKELRQMLGFSDERDFPDLLSSYVERVHPEDLERALGVIGAHINDLTGKTPYDVKMRLMKKDGTYRHFHAFGTTMRNKEGIALRTAGALEDINEKVLEHEKKRIEAERMAVGNQRLTLLVEGMKLALWDMVADVKDPIGGNNEFWWSDEFRRMLGFNNEQDFPNLLSSWSDRIHPEDKERVLAAFAAHINDSSGKTPYDLEYRLRLKDGQYQYFYAFGSTKRDAKGNPLRVAGAVKNINEQQQMKEQLLNKEKQIEENESKIKKIMRDIKGISENVSNGARQISDSGQNLAHGVSTQAVEIEKLSAHIEKIEDQTQEAARNAEKANELSKNAQKNALSGNEEMHSMLSSIEGIKDASRNIAKIIKTIEDIAFQTNLLALNAAVEAARAGEHGKGFAVVADEVRMLAGRSQIAAEETAGLITDTVNRVEKGTSIALKTAAMLESLVTDFENVSKIVEEIAEVSSEQSGLVGEAVESVSHISAITQENAAASEQSAAAAEELASQSETLVNLFNDI